MPEDRAPAGRGLAAAARNTIRVTFQSRFGAAEWLQPYTAATLAELGQAGTGRVDVICPGFVSDCLETLEEIAMEGRDTYTGAGGKKFTYIACLNERDDWLRALTDLVEENLQGMLAPPLPAAALAATRARALALGARD